MMKTSTDNIIVNTHTVQQQRIVDSRLFAIAFLVTLVFSDKSYDRGNL